VDSGAVSDPYTQTVMEHFRRPRNRSFIPPGESLAEEDNPLCGDRIRLTLKLVDGRIRDVRYDITGCALSIASASVMSCLVEGRSPHEARRLLDSFRAVVGDLPRTPDAEDREALGEAMAFEPVSRYPVRRKCVLLPWRALERAVDRVAGAGGGGGGEGGES